MRWMILALMLSSCGSSGKRKKQDTGEPPPTYELTDEPYTVLQGVWEPKIPPQETLDAIADGTLTVFDIDKYEEYGLGIEFAEGVPWVEHRELAPDHEEGTERRSVAWMWQAADPQIIDEESPIRFEAYDGLYRPGGHLTVQTFEAHVRTAQRINELSSRPFDFALLAGDLTDGSHLNEMQWLLTALNGGPLNPDSGAKDDPVPGKGNDFNDRFFSDGLDADWYAALGNHETLYNGGFGQLDGPTRAAAIGTEIYDFPLFENGFRDGSVEGAPVVTSGSTIADPNRCPLRLPEVLDLIYRAPGSPVGHGLTFADLYKEDCEPPDVTYRLGPRIYDVQLKHPCGTCTATTTQQRGYFSVQPIKNKPFRLIVLNTVDSNALIGAGAQGYIDREQLNWLSRELAASDDDNEMVVVMSHHRIKDLGGFSPTTPDDLAATLMVSSGLVLHVTGHGHFNQKSLELPDDPDVELGFWQLMLASTVDFPMQTRLIEIVDERNVAEDDLTTPHYATIYVTNIDHNSPPDSLAHKSRALAAGKMAFPDVVGDTQDIAEFWASDTQAQNLMLRIEIPEAVANNLADYKWSDVIESEDTLLTFDAPTTIP